MGRFGPRERTEFLAIKDLCYCGLGSAALLAGLGERLGQHLRADAICMVQLDPETALPIYVVSQGWSDDDHRPLIDYALLSSPAADPGRLIEAGRRTVSVDELVSADQAFDADPYVAYHLRLRGYRFELQTACTTGQRERALLTVSRRAPTGDFEPRHRRLLDAVAPHVAAGLHTSAVRESLAAPAASDTGLIVLMEQGDVALANAAGERWLSAPDAPGRPGRVWALHVLAGLLVRSLTPDGKAQVPAQTVTTFPHRPDVALKLTTDRTLPLKLRLRVPGWVAGDVPIRVNDAVVAEGTAGTYVTLDRPWEDGDRISFTLPTDFQVTRYEGFDQVPGGDRYALEYGPVLLALTPEAIRSALEPVDGEPLHFRVRGHPKHRYLPYYELNAEGFTCFPVLES